MRRVTRPEPGAAGYRCGRGGGRSARAGRAFVSVAGRSLSPHRPPPRSRPPARMSYMLPHLHNGWQVDQAILSEEDRVVVIRFGHDWDPTCMKMDEVLYSIAEKVRRRRGDAFCACRAFCAA